MEKTKSQTNSEKIKEYERLSKKICKVHLYDTLRFLVCASAVWAFGEHAIFTHSSQARKLHGTMAVVSGLICVGTGHLLNKKKQKLAEQEIQIRKQLNQCSKA